MGSRKYPPLTLSEVKNILIANNFTLIRKSGSHHQYEGYIKDQRRLVTVDVNINSFGPKLIKYMIKQSGLSRKKFYLSTKATARKIERGKK